MHLHHTTSGHCSITDNLLLGEVHHSQKPLNKQFIQSYFLAHCSYNSATKIIVLPIHSDAAQLAYYSAHKTNINQSIANIFINIIKELEHALASNSEWLNSIMQPRSNMNSLTMTRKPKFFFVNTLKTDPRSRLSTKIVSPHLTIVYCANICSIFGDTFHCEHILKDLTIPLMYFIAGCFAIQLSLASIQHYFKMSGCSNTKLVLWAVKMIDQLSVLCTYPLLHLKNLHLMSLGCHNGQHQET